MQRAALSILESLTDGPTSDFVERVILGGYYDDKT